MAESRKRWGVVELNYDKNHIQLCNFISWINMTTLTSLIPIIVAHVLQLSTNLDLRYAAESRQPGLLTKLYTKNDSLRKNIWQHWKHCLWLIIVDYCLAVNYSWKYLVYFLISLTKNTTAMKIMCAFPTDRWRLTFMLILSMYRRNLYYRFMEFIALLSASKMSTESLAMLRM